jgi:beta-1,4-mannosyl-glycoprotein beta-1,4-N-acetylglucosaminyltransferase
MFNDELALLDYRLRVLDPVVEHFVLVESTLTHTGQPKRAWFAENAKRFDRYCPKIRHVLVDDMPDDRYSAKTRHALSNDMPDASAWVLERFQRAAVWRGLEGVGQSDLVMVGDLDEVPDPAVVERLTTTLRHPSRLAMRHFVFAANFEVPDEWTDGTMVARGNQLRQPQMAVLMGDPDVAWSAQNDHVTPRAGCHLSFMGGRDAVAAKLRAYAHQEFAVPALNRPRHLDRCVSLGVHVAGVYAIKRRRLEQLPSMLLPLAEMHPDLFDFRPGPPRLIVLLYLAYARVRTRLPVRLLDLIDARPVPFAVVFGPFFVVVDALLRTAAKYRVRRRARRAVGHARRAVWRASGVIERASAGGG